MEWSTGGAVAKRFLSEPVAEGAVDLDVWEQCTRCSRWVNLGVRGEAAACECGETVRHAKDAGKGKRKYRHWAQCSECGKWRTVTLQTLRRIESLGDSCVWTCKDFKEGLTCRSRTGDWGSEVRKESERLEEIEKAVQTGGGVSVLARVLGWCGRRGGAARGHDGGLTDRFPGRRQVPALRPPGGRRRFRPA